MIEINLLPEELIVKKTSKGFELKQALYFIPLIFGILIIVHFYFACLSIIRNFQLTALSNQWQKSSSQRENLKEFQTKYALLSADVKTVEQLNKQRINWAEKLNKLSLYLPNEIWFNELSLSQKNFILKGSVISLQKDELTSINSFIDALKKDTRFVKDFNRLELNSVQRNTVGGYDIIDFILEGDFKSQ